MKQSSAGFTGNSPGSLGGASAADLKQGYIVVKDLDDDELGLSRYPGDYNPEPDTSIDRDSDTKTNWE